MRCYIFITLLFLSISQAKGQQWSQTAGPGGDFLQTTAINSDGHIFAARSVLHRSTDGGKSWKRLFQEAPPNSITSIVVQPSGRLIAQLALSVGSYNRPTSGQLFFSDDNGDTWKQLSIRGFQLWKGAKNEIFSVDSIMKFIRSTDDGNTWTPVDTTGVPNNLISATSDNSGNLFLISSEDNQAGYLYRSTDNGESWSKIVNGINLLTTIQCYKNGHLFAYDKGFHYQGVYHSSDNGRTWEILTPGLRTGISTTETGQVISYGPNAWTLHQYSNSGDSLVYIKSGNWSQFGNGNPVSVSAEPSGNFIVGGRLGTFRLNITDISSSERIDVPSDHVPAIVAHPNGEIIAFGGGDSLYAWHSSDGGASWVMGKSLHYGQFGKSISTLCLDSSHNILSGYFRKIIRSNDIGTTWAEITDTLASYGSNLASRFSGLLVHPNNSIFISGYSDGIFRSTDNGSTWDQLNKGIADHSLSSLAIDRNGNLYAGGKNIIYRSSDNGLNWSPLPTAFAATGKYVTAIIEDGNGNLIAALDSMGIFRSTDNGASWSKHSNGFTATKVNTFVLTPSGKVFAATDSGVFYLDTITGSNWTAYNIGLTISSVLSLCIDKTGRLYAGTDGSGVFSSTDTFGGIPTGDVSYIGTTTEVSLGYCYPNPVTSTTTIPFSIDRRNQISLEVTDALGKSIATIVTGMYDAGAYTSVFDTKGLSAGVYYIRLEVAGISIIRSLVKVAAE